MGCTSPAGPSLSLMLRSSSGCDGDSGLLLTCYSLLHGEIFSLAVGRNSGFNTVNSACRESGLSWSVIFLSPDLFFLLQLKKVLRAAHHCLTPNWVAPALFPCERVQRSAWCGVVHAGGQAVPGNGAGILASWLETAVGTEEGSNNPWKGVSWEIV